MSTVAKRLLESHGKGNGAEADAVAGVLLAARRTSVLLSQSCGELSTIHPYVYCPDSTLIAVLFC